MKPGYRWRILIHDESKRGLDRDVTIAGGGAALFDELVVDDWLHVEQMDSRVWSVIIGDLVLSVRIGAA